MKLLTAFAIFATCVVASTANAQVPMTYQGVYQAPVVVYSVPVVQVAPVYSRYSVRVMRSPRVYSSYSVPVMESPVYANYAAPVYAAYSVPASATITYQPVRRPMIDGVIDFERRKNAWLRRTFLGRP